MLTSCRSLKERPLATEATRSRRSTIGRVAIASLLGSLAISGLFASTVTDLQRLTVVPISGALLIPGLILIGMLMALVADDMMPAAVALVISSVMGSLLFMGAIAAPGARVPELRNSLFDRGLTFGMLAVMLSLLFGMAGIFVSWLVTAIFRPNRL